MIYIIRKNYNSSEITSHISVKNNPNMIFLSYRSALNDTHWVFAVLQHLLAVQFVHNHHLFEPLSSK